MSAGSDPIDASALDLDSYDLPGLRADIQQILDLPSAVVDVFRRSGWVIVAGAVAAWLVFGARMSRWFLVPYMGLVIASLTLAAVAIGGLVVFRKRVDDIDRAADRSLFTVAAMHGDLVRLQSSGGELPLREVASFITHTLVFPVLVGSAGNALQMSATTLTGPLGWFSNRLLGRVLNQVERRVLVALDAVDEKQLEQGLPEPQDGVVVDSWAELPVRDLPTEIRDWYETAHRYLSRVVDGLEVISVGGAGITTALATLPLIIVLALGWFLT